MERTAVTFRAVKKGDFKDDVTAVFLDMPEGPGMLTCYAHVGQHGTCSIEWILQSTRPAKPDEYAALEKELHAIGYQNLRIESRFIRRRAAD